MSSLFSCLYVKRGSTLLHAGAPGTMYTFMDVGPLCIGPICQVVTNIGLPHSYNTIFIHDYAMLTLTAQGRL